MSAENDLQPGVNERQTEMVQRAIGGDTMALKLLLTEIHIQMRERLARRIPADLRRNLDPDDVMQEVHVEVFRRIKDFELRGSDSFQRWIATIALSRLRNNIKRLRAVKRGGDLHRVTRVHANADDSTVALFGKLAGKVKTPSQCVAKGEALQAMKAAIKQLPDHYQQAIKLVYINGKSVKEVAAEMGRTERAVHGLCRRGLPKLEKLLGSVSQFLSSSD